MADENNSKPGNGAGDWIHAWIEQQREQLRRAGTPGAQTTDKASSTESAGDAFRDMSMTWGMQWLEAGQSYDWLVLRYRLDYSIPDIASSTGLNVNTVKYRLKQALSQLRALVRRDLSLRGKASS